MKVRTIFSILILFFLILGCEKKQNVVKEEIKQDSKIIINDASVLPEEQYIYPDDIEQFLLGNWYLPVRYIRYSDVQRNSNGVVYKSQPDMTSRSSFLFFGKDSRFGYDGNWWTSKDSGSILLHWRIPSETESPAFTGVWKIEIIDQKHIKFTSIGGYLIFGDHEGQTVQYTREETELLESIDNNNIEALREYLENGNDIDKRLLFDFTPLMYAITRGKTNAARFLIEQGADLSLQSITGYTPLHYAVMHSKFDDNILLNILEKGVDVNIRDESNASSSYSYNQTVLDLTIIDRPDENTRKIQRLLSEYGAVCSKIEWQDVVNTTLSMIMTFDYSSERMSITFSHDGSQLLAGVNRSIMLWDTATGSLIRRFTDRSEYFAHSEDLTYVAFSHDGRQIVSGSWDRMIKLWDASTGSLIRTFSGHTEAVRSVAFSHDGSWIVSGGWDDKVKLWNVATGKEVRTFSGHRNNVMSVAFNSDGSRVLSGSDDGTIKLWDVSTGREIRTFVDGFAVLFVSFTPDDNAIVSGSDYFIRLFDPATGREIRMRSETSFLSSVALSSDGSQIISGSSNKISSRIQAVSATKT
ncbi:MAG: ankyrin repeat domain-containing protein [Treponema sp.]|jgi:hypothetical protein|nr:ankyrin repeat domain-containing protein [Treponema sp.]